MIVKYTEEEFNSAKSADKLSLQCEKCGKIFYAEKKAIKFEIRHNKGKLKYCSVDCSNDAHHREHHLHCENCGKNIVVCDGVYKKSISKHFFCSRSCSASYNNKLIKKISNKDRKKISKSLKTHYSVNTSKKKNKK